MSERNEDIQDLSDEIQALIEDAGYDIDKDILAKIRQLSRLVLESQDELDDSTWTDNDELIFEPGAENDEADLFDSYDTTEPDEEEY